MTRHLGAGAVMLLLALGACADDAPPPPAASAVPASGPVCAAEPTSRWVDLPEVRIDGEYGRAEDEWIGDLGGGGWAAGRVYLYDAQDARVRILSSALAELGGFGREGEGPGELKRRARSVSWPRENWLWADTSALLVVDGRSVSVFDPDGRYRERYAGGARTLLALRAWPGPPPVLAIGVRTPIAPALGETLGVMDGVVVAPVEGEPIGAVASAPMVTAADGVPWSVPGMPVGLAAPGRGCVVLSDGHTPELLLVRDDGRAAGTIAIPLPERYAEPMEPGELRRLMRLAPTDPLPEIERRRRVRSVVVDPDGHVWVLTYPSEELEASGLEEMLVVDPERRTVRRDTLPAFPWFFGGAGDFYAVTRDRDLGVHVLQRYRAGEPSVTDGS